MVNAVFKISEDVYSLTIAGHADYNPGNDIVCSAISALAYTLAGELEYLKSRKNYTNLNDFILEHSEQEGDFTCEVTKITIYAEYKIKAIFQTIYIGLKQIEQRYPDNIKVILEDEKKLLLAS